MEQKVIVIGRNPLTALSVIRPLGKEGYTVDFLSVRNRPAEGKIASTSKYVHDSQTVPKEQQAVLEKLRELGKQNTERVLLFPIDDFSASILGEYQQELSQWFLFPYVKDGSVSRSMDKAYQLEMAAAAGMQVAKSWIVDLDTEEVKIPEDMVYPCFVKPLMSALGAKNELRMCPDASALAAWLVKLQTGCRNRSVLVQEYLNVHCEYTMGGVSRGETVYIPAVIRKTRVAQHSPGITLSGIMIDSSELGQAKESIVRFVKNMGFVGEFDLELLVTDKGIYFGELNLRPGGPNFAYYLSGVNLPLLTVQILQGENPNLELPPAKLGGRFYNDRVLWEDYAKGLLPTRELLKILREADFSLLTAPEDPMPKKVFRHYRIVPAIKKRVKGCVLHVLRRQSKA